MKHTSSIYSIVSGRIPARPVPKHNHQNTCDTSMTATLWLKSIKMTRNDLLWNAHLCLLGSLRTTAWIIIFTKRKKKKKKSDWQAVLDWSDTYTLVDVSNLSWQRKLSLTGPRCASQLHVGLLCPYPACHSGAQLGPCSITNIIICGREISTAPFSKHKASECVCVCIIYTYIYKLHSHPLKIWRA